LQSGYPALIVWIAKLARRHGQILVEHLLAKLAGRTLSRIMLKL
jgi:hypothetical protein